MRRVGLEPTQPKAATGSLVLRVCQFRHPREWLVALTTKTIIANHSMLVNNLIQFFSKISLDMQ